MLSYRHGFHAGNHADVLKHMTLCLIMRALTQKDKPATFIDTHSGAGLYDLTSGFASKNLEYSTGWDLIKDNAKLQELIPEYYKVCAQALKEPNASRVMYPGSPYFEHALARPSDSLFFHDTHPAEYESLLQIFKHKAHIRVELRSCSDTINALLPPLKKRGLIFIDPPYEDKQEYTKVVSDIKNGLGLFKQGVFALWYPVLARMQDHSKNLTQALKRLNMPLLQVEMRVSAQEEDFGMCGSGMLIINPPYQLEDKLSPIVEELYKSLCDPQTGIARLELLVPRP